MFATSRLALPQTEGWLRKALPYYWRGMLGGLHSQRYVFLSNYRQLFKNKF